ncbi:amidase family protein [Microbacterium sp. C7(2022)]|uniref:amidase family protein n=1 Tax=Microbacterium sp. C7(2022) TaxID=2992759 RepID=UPI00237B7AE8|nr:amidase family protein [Microbacterium sp. C7(2022)]MDE0547576.1 amidase family protein [Microbacterium sp. C7(2022)]
MTLADYSRASAVDLASALRRGEVRSIDLVDAALERVDRIDPLVNAVIVRDDDRARRDAQAADAQIAAGTGGPLCGVPITVKESFDLAGHPTTWGVPDLAGHRAERDALIVRRLTDAGAVVIGKTNVPVDLNDWQSDNPIYGRTNNPYDLSRTPGGSSGGSAAALALGYSALEVGSDIGGSVRVPAAFTGVFGHKSTWGIVPSSGHAPGGWEGVAPPLAVIGPLARSARDLALALEIVAGPDDLSPFTGLTLPPSPHTRLSDYRVLVLTEHPSAPTDAVIQRAVDETAERIAAAGAVVARSSDLVPDLPALLEDYRLMLAAVGSRRTPEGTPSMPVRDWFELLDRQQAVRQQWARLFEDFDVVLTPTFGTVAFEHIDEPDYDLRRLKINGRDERYEPQLIWPSLATYANLPATAVPVGVTAEGLPLSVQVIGAHRRDLTTIAFAEHIAREIPAPVLPH